MSPDEKRLEPGLYRLSELIDYEVADRDPDVRGWKVLSVDQKLIGKVNELIVDLDAMKVRYLDVNVNKEISDAGTYDRHLLIPIGAAELDKKDDVVKLNDIETVTLLKLPAYQGGSISRDYERSLRKSFNPRYEPETTEENFYNDELYDDSRFYRSRSNNLRRLSALNKTEVLGANPDIRNWEVITSDNTRLGSIDELIIDSRSNKIRYLDIDSSVPGRHYLVPIGLASLSRERKRILLELNDENIKTYPVFSGGEIDRAYENTLQASLKKIRSGEKDAEYYSRKHYDDSRFFGSRSSDIS